MFCEGLRSLARARKLPRSLPWKVTLGADKNTLWQRRDEVQMVKRLRMMDQMVVRKYKRNAIRFIHSSGGSIFW